MPIAEVVSGMKEGLITAATIVVGAFVARFLIGLVARYVPVVGQFAPEIMFVGAAFVAAYHADGAIVQKLAIGATIAGAFAIADKYVPSISAVAVSTLRAES